MDTADSTPDPVVTSGRRQAAMSEVVDLAAFRAARQRVVFGPDDDDPSDPSPSGALRPAPRTVDVAA